MAFAQPTDVVKVRFQAQVRMADGERRYNSTLDAYKTIARDEGVRGLWRGIAFSLNMLLPHIKKPHQRSEQYSFFQAACQTLPGMPL